MKWYAEPMPSRGWCVRSGPVDREWIGEYASAEQAMAIADTLNGLAGNKEPRFKVSITEIHGSRRWTVTDTGEPYKGGFRVIADFFRQSDADAYAASLEAK